MFALNGWAYDYFADYLRKSSEGQSVGMSYFRQKRGFTEATIQKFGLGYCSAKGDAMTSAALAARIQGGVSPLDRTVDQT